ncbi:MAG: hypothetical protein OES23_00205 [Nitrosopumilus sp.]|nr:hypothetical protein [Nitrosopumilus sp.]
MSRMLKIRGGGVLLFSLFMLCLIFYNIPYVDAISSSDDKLIEGQWVKYSLSYDAKPNSSTLIKFFEMMYGFDPTETEVDYFKISVKDITDEEVVFEFSIKLQGKKETVIGAYKTEIGDSLEIPYVIHTFSKIGTIIGRTVDVDYSNFFIDYTPTFNQDAYFGHIIGKTHLSEPLKIIGIQEREYFGTNIPVFESYAKRFEHISGDERTSEIKFYHDKKTGMVLEMNFDVSYKTNKIDTGNLHYSLNAMEMGFNNSEPSTNNSIPDWIRNTAKWWSEGSIGDDEFIRGLQYLLENKIIAISHTEEIDDNITKSSKQIPDWIRNTAKWWSEGSIGDSDFMQSIQWLILKNIIILQHNYEQNSVIEKLDGLSKYQNYQTGISIEYPETWYYVDEFESFFESRYTHNTKSFPGGRGPGHILLGPQINTTGGYLTVLLQPPSDGLENYESERFWIFVEPLRTSNITIEEYTEMENSFPNNYPLSSPDLTSLSGNDAYEGFLNDGFTKAWMIWTVKNETAYVLAYVASYDNYDANFEDINLMVESFQIN